MRRAGVPNLGLRLVAHLARLGCDPIRLRPIRLGRNDVGNVGVLRRRRRDRRHARRAVGRRREAALRLLCLGNVLDWGLVALAELGKRALRLLTYGGLLLLLVWGLRLLLLTLRTTLSLPSSQARLVPLLALTLLLSVLLSEHLLQEALLRCALLLLLAKALLSSSRRLLSKTLLGLALLLLFKPSLGLALLLLLLLLLLL